MYDAAETVGEQMEALAKVVAAKHSWRYPNRPDPRQSANREALDLLQSQGRKRGLPDALGMLEKLGRGRPRLPELESLVLDVFDADTVDTRQLLDALAPWVTERTIRRWHETRRDEARVALAKGRREKAADI
jgi:hypothetical protein